MKNYKHPSYSYVHVTEILRNEIDKIDFALCNQPTETPDAYYKRQTVKPDVITNGGFFSMSNGTTCFSYRDENTTIVNDAGTLYGVGIVGDNTLHYGSMLTTYRDFIAAYPPLVVDSKIATSSLGKELDYKARRTAIGWNDSTLYIVTVDSPGLKFSALAKIFTGYNCQYAINLDGGGSTRKLIDGKRVTSTIYARPVDNVFCVYLKKATASSTSSSKVTKTLYRVQVGAYKYKANAEKLKSQLVTKGYTGAFILENGNYYKVQVGTFSVKLNAERLKEQLIAKGYSAIIKTYTTTD